MGGRAQSQPMTQTKHQAFGIDISQKPAQPLGRCSWCVGQHGIDVRLDLGRRVVGIDKAGEFGRAVGCKLRRRPIAIFPVGHPDPTAMCGGEPTLRAKQMFTLLHDFRDCGVTLGLACRRIPMV